MKRKRIAALLLVVMACTSALSAGAAPKSFIPNGPNVSLTTIPITPFWENTGAITCTLNLLGTTADCNARVTGLSGTTKITGTLTLYRQSGKSWVYVDSWSDTSTSATLRFSEEKTVTSGYTYKLILRATVTRNGTSETVEKESAIKTCK